MSNDHQLTGQRQLTTLANVHDINETKNLGFLYIVTFESKKFSPESPKGKEDQDFQLYGLKIPGKYIRSTALLFHAIQNQSIFPLGSGVVTEEK